MKGPGRAPCNRYGCRPKGAGCNNDPGKFLKGLVTKPTQRGVSQACSAECWNVKSFHRLAKFLRKVRNVVKSTERTNVKEITIFGFAMSTYLETSRYQQKKMRLLNVQPTWLDKLKSLRHDSWHDANLQPAVYCHVMSSLWTQLCTFAIGSVFFVLVVARIKIGTRSARQQKHKLAPRTDMSSVRSAAFLCHCGSAEW